MTLLSSFVLIVQIIVEFYERTVSYNKFNDPNLNGYGSYPMDPSSYEYICYPSKNVTINNQIQM